MKKPNLIAALRPKSLDEVIGHDDIKPAIRKFIDQECQQWLFHGKTGTGKTSLAWIVARELVGPDYDPHEIQEINGGRISDVRDAVENRDQPSIWNKSKYRVYIMDEAQMFTDDARSLLLGPLEEQDSDRVWILCTMDVDNLDRALRDRCTAKFQLKGMGPFERRQLVDRAAKYIGYGGDTTKFLKAIDDQKLYSARDILGAFERFANNVPVEEAVGV